MTSFKILKESSLVRLFRAIAKSLRGKPWRSLASGPASTVKVERRLTGNTFTAHSEPYNGRAIHVVFRLTKAINSSRDDLRTRSDASGFRRGEGAES